MEVKLMTIFFVFIVVSVQADEYTSNQYMAIYYGDSKVNIGDSFTINCIIPVSDPITWLKDGKKILQHNLRHGKDDHAYNESESPISGEDNKIEAMINVKHALKVHEGNYQCNSLHTNFHKLIVENNEKNIIKLKEIDYFSTETPVKNILQWYFNDTLGLTDTLMPVVQNNRSSLKKESNKLNSNYSVQFPLNVNKTTEYDDKIETNNFLIPSTIASPTLIVTPKKKDDLLIPNYDNEDFQLKVYDIKTSLVLSCNITRDSDENLIWEKNGTDVSKVAQLKDRYRIIEQERKFIIDKAFETDAGLYSCGLKNEKKNITVVANVAVRVPSNTAVVEGEKLTIQCTVAGTDPKIEWVVGGNRTIENTTDRYILQEDEKKIQNALLIIENANLDDRGEYKCVAKNLGTEYAKKSIASDVSFVRVKGKMAALWPFLGICAEVFVLCAIILIYERRRNKTELEESDTDQNNEQN